MRKIGTTYRQEEMLAANDNKQKKKDELPPKKIKIRILNRKKFAFGEEPEEIDLVEVEGLSYCERVKKIFEFLNFEGRDLYRLLYNAEQDSIRDIEENEEASKKSNISLLKFYAKKLCPVRVHLFVHSS